MKTVLDTSVKFLFSFGCHLVGTFATSWKNSRPVRVANNLLAGGWAHRLLLSFCFTPLRHEEAVSECAVSYTGVCFLSSGFLFSLNEIEQNEGEKGWY